MPDVTKGEGVLFGKLQYLVYVENSYLCRVRCVSRNKPAEPIDAFIPLFERRSKKLSTLREKNDHVNDYINLLVRIVSNYSPFFASV